MSIDKTLVFRKHARERMVERSITHEEVKNAVEKGLNLVEGEYIRAIHEVKKGRFITVIYEESRKFKLVKTVYESSMTDIRVYRRMRR